jgi:hypothetical protein
MPVCTRLTLVTLLLACAHGTTSRRGREEPNEPPEPPSLTQCPACPEVPAITRPQRVVRVPCKLLPFPKTPDIDWAPPGCPVRKFGACLTRDDLAEMLHYFRDVEIWKRDSYNKCPNGQ